MSVTREISTLPVENIIDDLNDNESSDTSNKVNEDKMAALKAKLAAKKEETMPPRIVAKKTRSIRFGFVGTGQAGNRLAECAYSSGYEAIAFNTASQDLEHIALPDANKYLLQYGLGGAAKDLQIGREAAETHKDAINELVSLRLSDAQVLVLCLSLGGGSGAGSCETMIDVLSATGKPVIVITILPMSAEDAQTKRNALETLAKLAKEAQIKRIHNLIVVDNAKIESIYSDVSQMDFYGQSNKAIIDPLDAFNILSSSPSSVKSLDPMEFSKILVDGSGLCVYGEMNVHNYEEDTAIAEAVVENLNNGLLASGFDLKQSRYVGVMIVARKSVWSRIPSASVNYAMSMIGEVCGTPDGIFRGIYTNEEMDDNVVKVYSIFSGLGLPSTRVDQLKKEAAEYTAKAKDKASERNLNLKLETGTEATVSAADKIREGIAKKRSAFGNLLNTSVQDMRKKP